MLDTNLELSITFRTDASIQIGTGHVMRCLTLADALKEKGAVCRFICREFPGNLIELIRTRGFEAHGLPVETNGRLQDGVINDTTPAYTALWESNWATDAEQTLKAFRATAVDWLIVDHYALDARWERALRPACRKLMVIDDLVNRPHDCDILLDQNLHDDADCGYRRLVPTHCQLLLGSCHVLLRPAFDNPLPRTRTGQIQRVLVFFGGNDVLNQAGRAIEALIRVGSLKSEVILGTRHPHREKVFAAARHAKVRIHDNCKDMAGAMFRADLGIGTCGMAAWERCAMGLPTLVTVSADNQREDAVALNRLGAVENLGEAEVVDVAGWVDAINRALADPPRIARMGEAARAVVVGHSGNRLKLLELLYSHVD